MSHVSASDPSAPAAANHSKALSWLWITFAIVTCAVNFGYAAKTHARYGTWPARLFDRDFINYWIGGKLAVAGEHSLLFDPARYYEYLKSLYGADYQIHAWSYPPTYLLFVWPLGFLDYLPAMVLFLAGSFALYMFAAHVFMRRYAPDAHRGLTALAMVGFVITMVSATQNGFFMAALMLLALSWMHTRPVLAAAALACLTVKPHLGILLGLVVLIDRNWRVLAWTALFAGLMVVLSGAIFGLDSWRAFFDTIVPYQGYVMTRWRGVFLYMMPSAFASVRALRFSPDIATWVHVAVAVLSLPVIVWLLVKIRDSLERAFILLAGTFVLTPYAFNYDMGALVVAAALVAQSPSLAASRNTALLVAFAAVLPSILRQLGHGGLPIGPIVLIAALAAVARAAMPRPARS